MAHVFADRVADTSSTTGTGAFALDNEEPTGYQNFDDVCGNSDTIYYAAAHALLDEWEVGLGTYGAGTNVLTRTSILASSNGGSAVSFSSGTKHIIGTLPASVLSVLVDATTSAISGLTLAQGDLIYGTGVDTAATLTKDTNATRYLSNQGTNNNPSWNQVNLANGVTGDLPFANLTQGSALSVLGVTGNSTADNASIAAGSDHNILRRSGTAVAFGAIDLSQSGAVGSSVLAAANGGTGISSLGSGIATWLGTPSSANLRTALTDETGGGAAVFADTPTLIAPLLGTPTSGTLTNCTGFPVAQLAGLGTGVATALAVNIGSAGAPVLFNGALGTPSSGTLSGCTGLPISTGVSGLGSNVATFLATPSSANLASALTDETGTGLAVFNNSPTFVDDITVGTASSATGQILLKGTTSGTVTLSVADAAGTWTMKLPTTDGDSGQVLSTDGNGTTSWVAGSSGGGTLGTYTAFSGTEDTVTGISATAKMIILNIVGLSWDNTAAVRIRIGPSGGVATSGYAGSEGFQTDATNGGNLNFTAGFDFASLSSAFVYHGALVFTLADSSTNTWTIHGNLGITNTTSVFWIGGSVALSGALERIQITTVAGTASADAGSFNILVFT